jgi:hypothetical protein
MPRIKAIQGYALFIPYGKLMSLDAPHAKNCFKRRAVIKYKIEASIFS